MATKVKGKKTAPKRKTAHVPMERPASRDEPRRLKLPAYQPFRMKRIKYPEKLPSAWKLSRQTLGILWRNKKLFAGIVLVYILLNLVFVHGLGNGFDISGAKDQMALGLGGAQQFASSLLVFAALFGSSGSDSNPAGSAYQLIIGMLISLAVIWAARQIAAGQRPTLRQVFYQGMYPLVPFVLVLLVVLLQLLPLVLGAAFFTITVGGGIAATGLEQTIAALIFGVLGFISIYMVCSSLLALYIVTLPDMTPMKALKSARQLVRYRRGQVFRKLLYLPIAVLVAMALILVPAIVFVAPLAPWIFFILSMSALVVVHVYMYTLYKALLA